MHQNITPHKKQSSSFAHIIRENYPLKHLTWFQTGGNARYFSAPESPEELSYAINYARTQDFPIFMLGQGANILIHDEGYKGLVVKPHLKKIETVKKTESHAYVKAESGACFQELISWCLDHNIIGLEEFSGIPGTVGGSVFINIHYFEYLLSNFIDSAEVICKHTGNIHTVDQSWFNFGYNTSKLHEKEHYLASATFKLSTCDSLTSAYARGKRDQIIRHRNARYPQSRTCGSFFRNFFDHEVTLKTAQGKPLIYVAYYLDKIGVKGYLKVGDAIVSHKHANMIVNQGNATTDDIVKLTKQMQDLVYESFGIKPQPECQLIGFASSPYAQ
jgi:UDP-N-acetylmuramate dehydrogenase